MKELSKGNDFNIDRYTRYNFYWDMQVILEESQNLADYGWFLENQKFSKSAKISQILRFFQNDFHISIKVVSCASIYVESISLTQFLHLFLESAISPKFSKNQPQSAKFQISLHKTSISQ